MTTVVIGSTVIAQPAVAAMEDTVAHDAAASASAKRWHLVVSPYVWAASLGGEAALAGFDTDVDIPFSETFDHLDFVFMGDVELARGRWTASVDVQHVQTSQDQVLLAHTIGLQTTMTTVGGNVYYRIHEADLGSTTRFGRPRRFVVEPTVGVRWTKLEADVEVLGIRASRMVDWVDPLVGIRVRTDLSARWNLLGEVAAGGFGAGARLSLDAHAYLGYAMVWFGHPVVLRGGYRALYQDFETDDFTGRTFRWDVTQQGPVAGLSLSF